MDFIILFIFYVCIIVLNWRKKEISEFLCLNDEIWYDVYDKSGLFLGVGVTFYLFLTNGRMIALIL